MFHMATALVIFLAIIAAEQAGFAITLPEYESAVAADDKVLNAKTKEVIATNSPEFLMEAARLLEEEEMSEARQTQYVALLSHAANLKPRNRDDAKWVSRAQFDLAKHYFSLKEEQNKALALLESATALGHPKAPERLAEELRDTDPERAKELLRHAISLGTTKASLLLSELENDVTMRNEGIRRLEKAAAKGDKKAQDALKKYHDTQSSKDSGDE